MPSAADKLSILAREAFGVALPPRLVPKQSLRDLVEDCAGGMAEGRKLKAIIPGGSSTTVMTPDQLDTDLDFNSVAEAGSQLGAAEVVVRAFSLYFRLVNLAEERHRVRTLRSRSRSGKPVKDSIGALEVDPAAIDDLRITPVLTAHPTEAKRLAVVAGQAPADIRTGTSPRVSQGIEPPGVPATATSAPSRPA